MDQDIARELAGAARARNPNQNQGDSAVSCRNSPGMRNGNAVRIEPCLELAQLRFGLAIHRFGAFKLRRRRLAHG
jgi:hypothetical protein